LLTHLRAVRRPASAAEARRAPTKDGYTVTPVSGDLRSAIWEIPIQCALLPILPGPSLANPGKQLVSGYARRNAATDPMMMKLPRRLTNQRAYTIIEAMATIVIAGVVIGSALPHVDTRREAINTTINAVISDLRFARARSITTGTHYAFVVKDAETYEVQRLKETTSGAWVLDEVAKTNKLPSHISLVLTQPVTVEFNTRGMMVSSPNVLTIHFSDTTFGASHQISVWPSGQVYYEL